MYANLTEEDAKMVAAVMKTGGLTDALVITEWEPEYDRIVIHVFDTRDPDAPLHTLRYVGAQDWVGIHWTIDTLSANGYETFYSLLVNKETSERTMRGPCRLENLKKTVEKAEKGEKP